MNENTVVMVNLHKATFVPVTVEDWTLFASDGGEHWLRDLDLAERAELADPHDIRRTIEKAIKDGTLSVIGPGTARANPGPLVRIENEVVTSGKGRSQEVDAYYLNEEAALLLVTRLRTPKAIELTKAIVRIFLAVVRGEIPQSPYVPANDVEGQLRLLVLRQKAALEIYTTIPGLYSEAFLRHKVEHAVALVEGRAPAIENPLLSVEGYLQQRGINAPTRKSQASSFGKRLKALYFEKYGEHPPMQARDINHAERNVCSYTEKDRPLFDQVFAEMFTAPANQPLDLNTLVDHVPEPIPPPPPPLPVPSSGQKADTTVEGWSLQGMLERFTNAGMNGLTTARIKEAAVGLGLHGDPRYGHHGQIKNEHGRVLSRPWRYHEEAVAVLERTLRQYLQNVAGGEGEKNAMTSAVAMTGKVGSGRVTRGQFRAIRAPG
jgi:hypothetical protein